MAVFFGENARNPIFIAYFGAMVLLFWRTLTFVLLAITLWFALIPQPPALPFGGDGARHALAFFLLPLVAGMACRNLGLPVLWLVFALFGGLIEILQYEMGMGRQAQWSDWFIDLAALTAASAFLWLTRRRGKREIRDLPNPRDVGMIRG